MKIGKSQVDESVKVFGTGPVVIGDRSRIDAGVIICAGERGVYIGDNVHIAHRCILAGTSGRIEFQDFSCLGADGKVYTASEDPFVGLTNPTVPAQYRFPKVGDVIVEKHALVYADVILCPAVRLHFGCGVGAFSVVKKDILRGVLMAGNPLKEIGQRNIQDLMEFERRYRGDYSTQEHCEILSEYLGAP